jgi:membrane associated rhomboid family serine protease
MRIDYNAPLTLNFSLACLMVFVLNQVFPGTTSSFFTLYPEFNPKDVLSWWRPIGYAFGHGSTAHLLGNLSFILLLGPMLEAKYGWKKLLLMILVTVILTAIPFLLFFHHAILGASGIVFMFIVLSSFINARAGSIPLTFILVLLLFLGKEVFNSFQDDQISQGAHLLGGVCGSVFGVYYLRKR